MAFQLLVLSACRGCGWQWFCWRWEDHGVSGLCLHWRWYLVSSILMVAAVIFIQMMFAWKKRICFLLKGFHDALITCCCISRHGEALLQLWRIFCTWKRVCHCFLESHWKPWLEVRFSGLRPKAGSQVYSAVLSLAVSGTLQGVSMKQLFLSLAGPSGGEGLSDRCPRLRPLAPSALSPVSGPSWCLAHLQHPKSDWQYRGLWGCDTHLPVYLCSGLATSSMCLLVSPVTPRISWLSSWGRFLVGTTCLLWFPRCHSLHNVGSSILFSPKDQHHHSPSILKGECHFWALLIFSLAPYPLLNGSGTPPPTSSGLCLNSYACVSSCLHWWVFSSSICR